MTGFEGGQEPETQYTGCRGFHILKCGPPMFPLSSDVPGTREDEEEGVDPIRPHFVRKSPRVLVDERSRV